MRKEKPRHRQVRTKRLLQPAERVIAVKFTIKHEIKGRIRVHMEQRSMTCSQADLLLSYLEKNKTVTKAKVYERTGDAVIFYPGKGRKSWNCSGLFVMKTRRSSPLRLLLDPKRADQDL